jgi:hypothetical protein
MLKTPNAPSGNGPASPSRRKLLASGIGLTVVAAFGPWSAHATGLRRQGELFAFRAPDRDDIVFALALDGLPSVGAKGDHVTVRLHAGDYLWNFQPFVRGHADFALGNADRMFSGLVSRVGPGNAVGHLVAVAVPAERLPLRRLDVWAEIIDADGTRSRVGNPVVSRLLADDPRLLKLHAGLHPAVDRRLLSDAIAGRIATRPDGGMSTMQVRSRAKRLAGMILPDTLRFHPARPGGFTFAGMNGRRPEDAVGPVVQTILAGAPRTGQGDIQHRPSSQFPYFASPIAA